MGVNRTTILNAYRELKSEGFLTFYVDQGTMVLPIEETNIKEYQMVSEPIWNHYFSQYSGRFDGYEMNHLLSLANKKDIIPFVTGISPPACAPKHILAEMKAELDKNGIDESLIHSPVEGFMSLRITLKDYIVRRGSSCSPEEVMVVAGSQQGIDLVGRALIDSGDIIFVEEPTFFPAIQVFKAAGAKIIGIPMEPDGMNIDVLE